MSEHNTKQIVSYIKNLRNMYPEELPDGKKLVKEGIEIGNSFEAGYNRFCIEKGYDNHIEYKKECMKKGKIVWQLVLGLATMESQIEAIKDIYDFCQRNGFEMNVITGHT